MTVDLEVIVPTDQQVENLFSLLKKRQHSISHEQLPTYAEHVSFVNNHPYRAWFLIRRKDSYIASVYVQFDNSVGINNTEHLLGGEIQKILQCVRQQLAPLEPVPSVRYKDFFINVASSDVLLQNKLKEIGCSEHQRSYLITDA